MEQNRKKSKIKVGAIAFAALGFLISASLGLWLESLITDLAAQNIWLGRAAMTATALFVFAVVIFVARELRGSTLAASHWPLRLKVLMKMSQAFGSTRKPMCCSCAGRCQAMKISVRWLKKPAWA